MLEMFSGFDSLVNSMITPPRQEYSISDLGKSERSINKQIIRRRDFKLRNRRGYLLECSHFAPVEMKTKLPCVVYLHGSGCSRLEALPYVEGVCRNDMTLFCFDFSGSGQSQGPISSIGWYEQEDLEVVVHHLYNSFRVSRIALWGRSMGAITTLLYARRDYRISCIVVDSSFASFKQLVQEFAKKIVSLPSFMAFAAFSALRSAILKKAGFDIELLEPINHVEKMSVPALFATGDSDDFILPTHTKQLHELYKGAKGLIIFEGGHNSQRPSGFIAKAIDFLKQYTAGVNDALPENLQKGEPSLRTEPLKFFKKASEGKAEKVENIEEKKSIKSLVKFQGVPPKKPLNQQKSIAAPAKPVQKEPAKQTKGVVQPRFQFSWLEHSSSSPSLYFPQKESTTKVEEEKTNNYQVTQSEVSFENPQKDSVAIENSPLQPNQSNEVNMTAKRKENIEPTTTRAIQSGNASSSNLKQNPGLNPPVSSSSNVSEASRRKHLPIFQNVEKKPIETVVLKIDLSTILNQQQPKESVAEHESNLKQESEKEKSSRVPEPSSEKESNALDSFRMRSYSSSVLTKTPNSSSSSQSYLSYFPGYQKTTFASTLGESPRKANASVSTSSNSTSSLYQPNSSSKYNYKTASQSSTRLYEKKTYTLGESSPAKQLSLKTSNTGEPSNFSESSKINVVGGQEPLSAGSNSDNLTPRKNEYSPMNEFHNYSPPKNASYYSYQNQQRNVGSLIKPYKPSEYLQKALQAKKSQNRSVDIILVTETPGPKGIFTLQKSPAIIEQQI